MRKIQILATSRCHRHSTTINNVQDRRILSQSTKFQHLLTTF